MMRRHSKKNHHPARFGVAVESGFDPSPPVSIQRKTLPRSCFFWVFPVRTHIVRRRTRIITIGASLTAVFSDFMMPTPMDVSIGEKKRLFPLC